MLRKGSVSRIEMDGLVFDVELEVDTRRSSFKKKRKKKKKGRTDPEPGPDSLRRLFVTMRCRAAKKIFTGLKNIPCALYLKTTRPTSQLTKLFCTFYIKF